MSDQDETYPRYTVDADGYLIEYADEASWHYLRHDDEQEVDADKLSNEYPDFIYNYHDV